MHQLHQAAAGFGHRSNPLAKPRRRVKGRPAGRTVGRSAWLGFCLGLLGLLVVGCSQRAPAPPTAPGSAGAEPAAAPAPVARPPAPAPPPPPPPAAAMPPPAPPAPPPSPVALPAPPQPPRTSARPPTAARPTGPTAAPMRPTPVAEPCPASLLAPFPWPSPPRYTSLTQVPNSVLFGADTGSHALREVANRLDGAITAAGYGERRYLGAGCRGFAIMLDLERLEPNGSRQRPPNAFAPPGQTGGGFELGDWIKRLFVAPKGFYRQIVLVVSDELPSQTTPAPSAEQLRRIAELGRASLPPELAALPYAWNYQVLALVYEFEKGDREGDARQVAPSGKLAPLVHLKKARLLPDQPAPGG